MKTLLTVEEYINKEKISKQAVYKRIRNNQLEKIKIKNKTYIVLDSETGLQNQQDKTQEEQKIKEKVVYKERIVKVENEERELKLIFAVFLIGFFVGAAATVFYFSSILTT